MADELFICDLICKERQITEKRFTQLWEKCNLFTTRQINQINAQKTDFNRFICHLKVSSTRNVMPFEQRQNCEG